MSRISMIKQINNLNNLVFLNSQTEQHLVTNLNDYYCKKLIDLRDNSNTNIHEKIQDFHLKQKNFKRFLTQIIEQFQTNTKFNTQFNLSIKIQYKYTISNEYELEITNDTSDESFLNSIAKQFQESDLNRFDQQQPRTTNNTNFKFLFQTTRNSFVVNLSCNQIGDNINFNIQPIVKSVSLSDDGMIVVDLADVDKATNEVHENILRPQQQQQQQEQKQVEQPTTQILEPLIELIKEEKIEVKDVAMKKQGTLWGKGILWSSKELAYLIHGAIEYGDKSLDDFNKIKKRFGHIFDRRRTPGNLQRRLGDLRRKHSKLSLDCLFKIYRKYIQSEDIHPETRIQEKIKKEEKDTCKEMDVSVYNRYTQQEMAYLVHGALLYGHKKVECFNEIKQKFDHIFDRRRTPTQMYSRFRSLFTQRKMSLQDLHKKYSKYIDTCDLDQA